MIEITLQDAKNMLQNYSDGTFFTVFFKSRIKKTMRMMNCRKFTKSNSVGCLKYNPTQHNLLLVLDVQLAAYYKKIGENKNKAYRMIPFEGIKEIHMKGEEYKVIS